MLRGGVRRRLLARGSEGLRVLDPQGMGGPTLVLAPHPDDETLGCGGLIALLRDLDRTVEIAFITDGAGSHPTLARSQLAALRQSEAEAAAHQLGVATPHLHFLEFPDGALAAHRDRAIESVLGVLNAVQPQRVVLPHGWEPNVDHRTTHQVAVAAVRRFGRALPALSYFVWFWDQWPWTNPLSPPRGRLGRRAMLETAWRGRLGFGVMRHLTHAVDVSSVLDRKQAALACHRTQTERPPDQPGWETLVDVADGDWLDLLLQPTEVYTVGEIGGA